MKSQTILKKGHVGSKTRSLGQILEKRCVLFCGHIFSPIILKLWCFLMKLRQVGKCIMLDKKLGQILVKPCARFPVRLS